MRTGLLIAGFLVSLGVQAQDSQRGKELYENHCLSCHYERIHNRDPQKSLVKSRSQLRVQVEKWAQATKQRFAVEDLDDIAEYLDRSHYKLEK